MVFKKESVLIGSISSDIGYALAIYWISKGHSVAGTYRTESANVEDLRRLGVRLFHYDLSSHNDFLNSSIDFTWTIFVSAFGELEPIGPFFNTDINRWIESVETNFVGQIRLLRYVEKFTSRDNGVESPPVCLFFAGGGTNSATINFSSYTVSKIALIKMVELLDAERQDLSFVIVGPGWVETKIHQATISAGEVNAGEAYSRTLDTFDKNSFYSMASLCEFCDWIISQPREVVSGRNFSAVHDDVRDNELLGYLKSNNDAFKLRRFGNSRG